MTIKNNLLCVLPFFALLTGCLLEPKVWVKETVEMKVEPKTATRLISATHNGAIRSIADAKLKVVTVTAEIQGGGATLEDAQAALEAIETFCIEKDGAVTVGWNWADTKKDGWGAKVALEIHHPVALAVSHTTHNGSVSIEGAEAGVKVLTHNGSIRVKGSSSEVDLVTHNGGISALLSTEGALSGQLKTHNGQVLVTLAEAVSTKIVADTHNGSASCSREATDTKSSRAHWAGTVGQGEGSLKLESHNGSVVVK